MSNLTRKHFNAIAASVAAMPVASRKQIAEQLAITLSSTNPRFNRQRFLDACKIEEQAHRFIVVASRSNASIFGAAHSACKRDGEIVYYSSLDDARKAASEYNRKCVSGNIYYNAERAQ